MRPNLQAPTPQRPAPTPGYPPPGIKTQPSDQPSAHTYSLYAYSLSAPFVHLRVYRVTYM
eukprot:1184725-Prorocentrum_minimum.AAC.5